MGRVADFLVVRNRNAPTVRMVESAVASGSSDMNKSVDFESADECAD